VNVVEVKERAFAARAFDELERENFVEARSAARQCLRVNPASRECFHSELFSYSRSGDFANALLLLEECLFDDPDDVDCPGGMVTQRVRTKDFGAAREAANRLRELAKSSVTSLLSDAQIAEATGDPESAQRLYEGACTHDQEFACNKAASLRATREK
jgi:tetratricopeptide (TPR) repeat protein